MRSASRQATGDIRRTSTSAVKHTEAVDFMREHGRAAVLEDSGTARTAAEIGELGACLDGVPALACAEADVGLRRAAGPRGAWPP